LKYRFRLHIVSSIFWYIQTTFYQFLENHLIFSLYELLKDYILISIFLYILLELVFHTAFYKFKYFIILYAILLTIAYPVLFVIPYDLFTVFALFFTNISYSLMLGYSLKSQYLL